jgi:hypothetical protein
MRYYYIHKWICTLVYKKRIPRVSPSSNSLTDFALAANGILYSPPISSKRRACLQKQKILGDTFYKPRKQPQVKYVAGTQRITS